MSGYSSRVLGIAALVALGLALPASAAAQTFVDPRQAGADQYGTPTPTPEATPTPTPAAPRIEAPPYNLPPNNLPPASGPGSETGGGGDGTEDGGGAAGGGGGGGGGGGDGDGTRREQGSDVGDSLPFTGLNVSTLILIGLMLAATGFGLRAMQSRRASA